MAESLHLSSRHREEIEALLHKHLPGVEIWAYGSRVNGRSHDGSDLDLVLRGPQLAEIDTSRLADFIEALQDSTIPFLVKARDWAHLPKSFHSEIEREHVVLVGEEEPGMASGRRYIPASEFCASVRDGTHDSPKPVERGRKLVTSRHLTTGQLDLSDAYLISEEDFEYINKRSKVDKWDVLISMIGTVGEPCLIKEEPDFAIKNIGLFKTRSEADGKWLYYYLRSKAAQKSIREQSRGTTQQYIPLGALRGFPILVADDLEEQKKHRSHPGDAGRQDRVEPAHERDAGGDGPGVVQVLVRRFRPCAGQDGGPGHRAAQGHCRSVPRPPRGLGAG